jgi:hypothetical protein
MPIKLVEGTAVRKTQPPGIEAAILSRVVQPTRDDLTPASARAFLRFKFAADDQQRMHELATKNQSGVLTPGEEHELDSYVRVGRLIDLLAAKARVSLKKRGRSA